MLCLEKTKEIPVLTDIIHEHNHDDLKFDFLFEHQTNTLPLKDEQANQNDDMHLEFDFSLTSILEDHPSEEAQTHNLQDIPQEEMNLQDEYNTLWANYHWEDFNLSPDHKCVETQHLLYPKSIPQENEKSQQLDEEIKHCLMASEQDQHHAPSKILALQEWLTLSIQDQSLQSSQKGYLEKIILQLSQYERIDTHVLHQGLLDLGIDIDTLGVEEWIPVTRSEALIHYACQLSNWIAEHTLKEQKKYFNDLAKILRYTARINDLQPS